MQVQRTIPIAVPDDPDVLITIRRFQRIQRIVSSSAFDLLTRAGREGTAIPNGAGEGTDGNFQREPPSAITLHRACYAAAKGLVSAQMTASAIRGVAGAYRSAWRKGHRLRRHFAFRRPQALWLIGERGRDASFPEDGTLSLWTVAGRKRIPYSVPPHFRDRLSRAVRVNSPTIIADPSDALVQRWDDEDEDGEVGEDDQGNADGGTGEGEGAAYAVRSGHPLRAWLTVTVEVPDPAGHLHVGVDRGAVNALESMSKVPLEANPPLAKSAQTDF